MAPTFRTFLRFAGWTVAGAISGVVVSLLLVIVASRAPFSIEGGGFAALMASCVLVAICAIGGLLFAYKTRYANIKPNHE